MVNKSSKPAGKAGKGKASDKPKALKITNEAKEIAADMKKDELIEIAEDQKVKIDKKAKEEVIAQTLLNAGVEFEDADEASDTSDDEDAEEEDDGTEEDEKEDDSEEEDEDDDEEDDDDEEEEEEEEEAKDQIRATGKFESKKAGSSVKVYWPNGGLCRVYTVKQVKKVKGIKTPAEAAEMFIKKKNNQMGGMPREGSVGKPVYPKGMTGDGTGTRPTNHVVGK